MLGGFEITCSGQMSTDLIDMTLRLIRAAWPKSVVELADGSCSMQIEEAIRQRHDVQAEFFIYRCENMKTSWDLDGRTHFNRDGIIGFTSYQDGCTFLVDRKDSETAHLVYDCVKSFGHIRYHDETQP